MQITDVRLFLVDRGDRPDWGTGYGPNWAFVRIDTDEGIHGIGEAFHSLDEPVEAAIRKFKRWLIGQDPTRIIHNWQAIYRGLRYPLGTGSLAALSALEHAMWDIAGKKCGLPVYKMLGGPVRDRIRIYANPSGFKADEADDRHTGGTGFYGDTQVLVRRSLAAVRAGFTAVKFAPQPDDYASKSSQQVFTEMVERVRAVREAVGDSIDIALDYHGRSFSPVEAIRLAHAIEPYYPLFLEEPALTEHPDALAEVKAKSHVPIAAGERAVTRDLARALIEKRAIHIIQPEPTANGGILETVKLAAMAELYGITVAPHMAVGAVALTVCVHIDAVIPNFLIQEYNSSVKIDSQVTRDVIIHPPLIVNGHVELPQLPGLGIDVNIEAAADYPPNPYDRPVMIAPDGSVALE